jgi:hypothetical protein
MRSRTSPLILAGLALLAGVNGLLLVAAARQAISDDFPVAEDSGWVPQLPKLDAAETQTTAAAAHQEILAHPIFSRSRVPFAPPPPAPPKPAQPPAAVFIDPGFVLGGVMINGDIKKAYLLQKTNHNGAWVGEGEDFAGWKVQTINAGGAKLRKESRVIEVLLYAER